MKKSCFIRTHSSSRRNSNVSLTKQKEPQTRYQSPHALAFPASLLLFFILIGFSGSAASPVRNMKTSLT